MIAPLTGSRSGMGRSSCSPRAPALPDRRVHRGLRRCLEIQLVARGEGRDDLDRVIADDRGALRGPGHGARSRAEDIIVVAEAAARDRVIRFLAEGPDEHLRQVRPFVLARVWALDRRAVLGAFLHATRAGLFDLRWMLHCPVCRVASAVAPSLASLDGHGAATSASSTTISISRRTSRPSST
jgi:hypothetical protein